MRGRGRHPSPPTPRVWDFGGGLCGLSPFLPWTLWPVRRTVDGIPHEPQQQPRQSHLMEPAWDAQVAPLSSSARNNDPYEWTVQFGELSAAPSLWNLQAYQNRYQVQEIVLSPLYLGTSAYDIALLKLSSSVTYNKYIQPICVQASSFEFQNRTDCWVTGWGDITEEHSEAGDRRGWGRGGWHCPCPHSAAPATAAPTLIPVQLGPRLACSAFSPLLLPSAPPERAAPLYPTEFLSLPETVSRKPGWRGGPAWLGLHPPACRGVGGHGGLSERPQGLTWPCIPSTSPWMLPTPGHPASLPWLLHPFCMCLWWPLFWGAEPASLSSQFQAILHPRLPIKSAGPWQV
uniref:Peptidase S1 domain-containing protein n=1 Tax=Equus asinus asinus TaxID=83772 RepID=A0A8C4LH91_EQUAS